MKTINNNYRNGFDNIEIENGDKALTIGTFDMLHHGHINLIKKMIEVFGEESVIVAVSSDGWSKKKKKFTFESEIKRTREIRKIFPNIKVIIENSNFPYSDLVRIYEEFQIKYLVCGEDHLNALPAIEKIRSENNFDFEIIFTPRTKGISSTLIREKRIEFFEKKIGESGEILKIIFDFEKSWNKSLIDFVAENYPNYPIKNIKLLNPNSHNRNVWEIGEVIYKDFYSIVDNQFRNAEEIALKKCGRYYFNTRRGFVYRKIVGKNIQDNKNLSIEMIEKIYDKITWFSKLNFENDDLPYFSFEKMFPKYDDFKKFFEIDIDRFEKIRNTIKDFNHENQVPSHGDLNSGNIIISNDNEISLIDFEFASFNVAEWDIAAMLCHLTISNENIRKLINIKKLDLIKMEKMIKIFLVIDSFENYKTGIKNGVKNKVLYGEKQFSKLLELI